MKNNLEKINREKNFIRSTCFNPELDRIEMNEDYYQALNIIYIERLVHRIVQSNEVLFYVKNIFCGFTIKCKDVSIFNEIRRYCEDVDFIRHLYLSFPAHRLSPYVELFIENLDTMLMGKRLHNAYNYRQEILMNQTIDMLNKFIDNIRTGVKNKEFKATVNNYERVSDKNYKSLLDYIDNLFDNYSRLLVLRVDFGYKKDRNILFTHLNNEYIYQKYLQTKNDFERFLRNTKSKPNIFKYMVGYVWKLEFARLKGFHYHLLFFFDGSKVKSGYTNAQNIGDYWKTNITQGRGVYFNCNAKVNQYRYPGIGMINHFDTALRENLNNWVAPYLTKTDYYARLLVLDEHGKTFDRGQIKSKVTKRGRPRNPPINIQQERYASEIILIEQLVHGIIQSKEFFCVCDNRAINRYYIGANDDFMRDVLKMILKYKKKIAFIEWILSLSVHPTVALFMRNMKDRVVWYHLYTRRRNRSKLEHRDVRVLNEFIESIRHEADSPQFKKAINDYHNSSIVS